jgi:hypothetical protein
MSAQLSRSIDADWPFSLCVVVTPLFYVGITLQPDMVRWMLAKGATILDRATGKERVSPAVKSLLQIVERFVRTNDPFPPRHRLYRSQQCKWKVIGLLEKRLDSEVEARDQKLAKAAEQTRKAELKRAQREADVARRAAEAAARNEAKKRKAVESASKKKRMSKRQKMVVPLGQTQLIEFVVPQAAAAASSNSCRNH